MTSTFVNDLRLNEMGTGDQSGTWGNVTNTNLELIAEALGFGTEAITTNADTHATTIADGATDPGRAIYIRYTGTLDSACTITIGPDTISRLHIIENATSGSQNIIIKQGSGSTVTIGNGAVKAVYLDGAGGGAAVNDALVDLDLTGTTTVAALTASGVITGSTLEATGDTSAGDNAAIGFTSTEGLILTGQGSTNDVTIKNDADADVISIPTGATGVTFAGDITANGDTNTFSSANATDPLLIIKNTTNDTDGARLRFVKDKGAAGADDDIAGQIEFFADDDNQDNILFANITAQVADASNGAEGGKISVGVATHDGEFQNGLILADGDAEDEVDVTLGNGAASVTTVSGTLTSTGAITSNAGVVVDEMTIDGDTITATDDFIIDAAADITLDAAGEQIIFKDGSTNVGHVDLTDDNFTLKSLVSDKDFVVKGNDGGSEITAMTLDMSGAGAATFNNNVTAFSDERLKSNINTLEHGLEKVNNLRGVTYTRDGRENIGVIAQEVEEVLPNIVLTADDEMGTKSVDYGRITAVLIEAVKELTKKVEELENK